MASLYGFAKRVYLVRVLSFYSACTLLTRIVAVPPGVQPSRSGSSHRVPPTIWDPRRGKHRTYSPHLSGQKPSRCGGEGCRRA